ncbi:MAG: hypothetical protein AABY01_02435 [Nanoarchaeota archaeon]
MSSHDLVLLILVLLVFAVALSHPEFTGQASFGHSRTASVRLDPVDSPTPRIISGVTGWSVIDPVDELAKQ